MKRKILSLFLAFIMILAIGLTTALPAGAATEEDIQASIEAGIAWLASVQNVNGSWGPSGSDQFGTTGLILVKLQDRAFELEEYDGPFDPDYPLIANVEDGLDYLFNYANTFPIDTQPAGDPDTNVNSLGVSVANRVYDTGILMMAIAAGRDPTRIVSSGPLAGWSYGAVLQDMADWMAFAQADYSDGLGGWYYSSQDEGAYSDQSNSGYAMLGILYAQAPLYNFNCDIPDFVSTELNVFIDNIQCDTHGGSIYYVNDPRGDDFWENSLKTGNLLTQMAFYGDTPSETRVQNALAYIGSHWNDDWVQGWGKTGTVQYQATYCLMKGFETMGIPLDGVPGVTDWYQDMAVEIIDEQNADGSWPANNPAYIWPDGMLGHPVSAELGTVWALLTLERFAPPPPVIEVSIDVKPMSWPNPFNLNQKGVLPIAVLGTEDFDVTTIDPATVLLEVVAPLRWALEDVGTPGDQLAGPDGFIDLTLKFDSQEIAQALVNVLDPDPADGDIVTLHLTGNLFEEAGGTAIAGEDVVVIIKKK